MYINCLSNLVNKVVMLITVSRNSQIGGGDDSHPRGPAMFRRGEIKSKSEQNPVASTMLFTLTSKPCTRRSHRSKTEVSSRTFPGKAKADVDYDYHMTEEERKGSEQARHEMTALERFG